MQTILPDLSVAADAGVRFLAMRNLAQLRHAAQKQQFFLAEIDCEACQDTATLLAQIARVLDFPAWFGHNRDALYDCLTDLSILPIAPGHVLLLRNLEVFRRAVPAEWEQFQALCNDAAAENAAQKPAHALWTFVLDKKPPTETANG